MRKRPAPFPTVPERVKGSNPGKDADAQEALYQLRRHARLLRLRFSICVQIDTDIDGQRLSQIVQNAK